MSAAAAQYDGHRKFNDDLVSFSLFYFHTVGELCLSPVSLSFVTKLAPAKYASIMMGIYFATTGLGNKSCRFYLENHLRCLENLKSLQE